MKRGASALTLTQPALSRWQKTRGLLAAAAVAWGLTTLVDVGWPTLEVSFATTFLHYDTYVPPPSQVLAWGALYALFGIPLAVIACLVVGFPAWRFAEKRGLKTRAEAIKVGGVVGLIVGSAGIVLGVLAALPTALSDSSTYNEWSWGQQTVSDGLPTLLGWGYQAIRLLITAGVGCLAGLAAWAVAGHPRVAAS